MDLPPASSRVTAVTVYRRGAAVTRTATLELDPADPPTSVRLEGLPLLLDDASLQVELHAEGPGRAPVAGDLQVTLAVPAPDPELRPPTNDELEAASLAYARAQRTVRDLEAIVTEVGELVPGPRGTPEEGQPPMASPTRARLDLLALRDERLAALAQQLAAAHETARQAKERLDTLQERERRASQARNPRTFEARKAVVLAIEPASVEAASRVRLSLRYQVPGARWAPSYVLRLDRSLRTGTLEVRALVGQATGERWTDAALTLSTAHPQQWTELPELRSLRIGQRQPPPPKTGWRPPPTGSEALFADYDRDLVRRRPPPAAQPVFAPPSDTRTRTGMLRQQEVVAFDEDDDAVSLGAPQAPRGGPPVGGFGPPPGAMPMPSAMPPPAPMAPPPMAMAGMAAPAPKRMARPSASAGDYGGGGSAPMEQAREEAPASVAATLTADRSQLDYGRLRLPAADEPGRGVLRSADATERYGGRLGLPPEQVAAALGRASDLRRSAQALDQAVAPVGHQWAQASDGFDYAYPAQAPVDLDSDGEPHGLPVRAAAVEAKPRYVSVPRETQDVFRVVALRNPLEAPLLPGPVDVYVDGRFVLATELPQTPPGGRVELGLGVEQAIKIARNVSFEDEASGLLKRSRELEHRIRVDLTNHLPEAVTVEVRERVPVPAPGQDDVEVSERRVEPEWDEHEQREPELQGGRAWKVEVAPGATRQLHAVYSIKIPSNHELVGGNRREG